MGMAANKDVVRGKGNWCIFPRRNDVSMGDKEGMLVKF